MDTWIAVSVLVALAVSVVVTYMLWPTATAPPACAHTIHRNADGTLTLQPGDRSFPDMNAFQQWWHSSGMINQCPIPVLTGRELVERDVMEPGQGVWGTEQTFATTPIYKVDDYEFSRIFGYERNGHMHIPRQNFNLILEERTFDWADRPLSSDERRDKYRGLQEGFSADGDLKSEEVVRDAAAQFHPGNEKREVAKLVAAAYDNDPNWEPVVTKVGPNHWEVNELVPRRREGVVDAVVDDSVVNTADPQVNVQYQYPDSVSESMKEAIDPFFTGLGDLRAEEDQQRYRRDPYYGPVPGMERMMGPTFDHKKWF